MQFSFKTNQALFDALLLLGVAPDTIAALAGKMKMQTVKANQLLVQAGQVNTHLYYVLSGGFVCRYINHELEIGRTINVYLNDLHPFMACIDSFFTQDKSECELRAFSQATVLSLAKDDLDALVAADVQLKLIFDAIMVKALTEENDLKLKIIAYKPEVLYPYLLQTFPILVQAVPSKYIAELMGISAEWLSKLKAKSKNIGTIS